MKNSTLFFRSLLIIAIIAGIPHALAIYAEGMDTTYEPIEESAEPEAEREKPVEEDWSYSWQGRYEVTYEGMAEKAIYEIKNEKGILKAYAVAYIDDKGNRYPDGSLIMKELIINEYKAEASYQIDYDGEQFEVKARLQMDEEGHVSLSYRYEGFEVKESWKRIQ